MHVQAMRIRALERLLLDLFAENRLFGTVHTCIGQEYCAAALHLHLDPERDAFFGSHRCHGHYLAWGGPTETFLAELMGREGALCGGRGGSQHLHYGSFFSSGIQGGTALLATGFAWGLKLRARGGVAVAQMGDGTLGEGAVYEAFNFAALLGAPVLFLIEWNGYAQSTDVSTTTSGDPEQRIRGFGLDVRRLSDRDPDALGENLAGVIERVRQGRPQAVIVDTRRLMGHSKGDDGRPEELLARLNAEDPLRHHLADDDAKQCYTDIAAELHDAAEAVLARPAVADHQDNALPPLSTTLQRRSLHADLGEPDDQRIVTILNACLHNLMEEDPTVVCLGEDLADPYGGAFKVSRGLSTRFPERLFSTPISEAAVVGAANGLALSGYRPIAEIMFADFVLLAADQLINHAAKIYHMYAGQASCPVTIRLVSGGGRGYGPTHSQSLEAMLCGVPGLRVVALSPRHRPDVLLRAAVQDDAPTVFVEHKLLYPQVPVGHPPLDLVPRALEMGCEAGLPPLRYGPPDGRRPEFTIVTYGGMTTVVEQAMRTLFIEEELDFDYFVYSQLSPLDVSEVSASVRTTGRLLVVEEGPSETGFGAAVLAAVCQAVGRRPLAARTLGARAVPVPCARHLEQRVLPSAVDVVNAAQQLLEGG